MRAKLQSAIDENTEHLAPVKGEGEAPKSVKPGDTLLLVNLNTKGVALTASDSKGNFEVQSGAIKLKVNIKDVRIARPEKPEKKKPGQGSKTTVAQRPVQTEVDLRGMLLDEAILAVDLFLDAAVINRLKTVNIIHGKGTGVLRSGVQQHLRQHPYVQEFRLGRYGEGEDGVTVVTMK